MTEAHASRIKRYVQLIAGADITTALRQVAQAEREDWDDDVLCSCCDGSLTRFGDLDFRQQVRIGGAQPSEDTLYEWGRADAEARRECDEYLRIDGRVGVR